MLDARARTLAFCNAGHNAPMLVRADGTVRRLETGGLIAGVFDTATYDGGAYALAAGRPRAVLHRRPRRSRDLSESSEYGDDRLVDTLIRHRALDPAALVERLFADVHAWAGRGFDDDATALVARGRTRDVRRRTAAVPGPDSPPGPRRIRPGTGRENPLPPAPRVA